MATKTGRTRTLTGFIADLLEYPRWVIEHDVDFTNCRYGSHHNAFIAECRDCRFGAACQWLDKHRTPSIDNASLEELVDALETAVGYLHTAHRHEGHCDCATCEWLREARHFRRSHLRQTCPPQS